MDYNGLKFIEPNMLYNMLQQANFYPHLSDPNYLLLIDARTKSEYNESHVLTAKKAPKSENGQFLVPYDAELECKQNIVIYDSNTSDFAEPRAPAVLCGYLLWEMGSRNPVHILKGGYEEFSALYPFLRTQKIIYMPRELDDIKPYPIEILPGSLYLGNWFQGNEPYIQKDLKIKAHVNVCVEAETFFAVPGPQHLHIQVEELENADLLSHFPKACSFIDQHREEKEAVLVFDHMGISRCVTVIIGYLMHHNQWPLQVAYDYVRNCMSTMKPNRSFIKQLLDWEMLLFESQTTDIEALLV